MSHYRKLGRTASQRKALLRNQVTNLIYNGKIVTTESKAKEIVGIVDGMIALAVKEKDNFETVTVKAKEVRKDKDGNKVKEDGKYVYDEVDKEIKKDNASKLNARRKMLSFLYPVTYVPADGAKKKENTEKLFNEIAPKYTGRNGGYTRIVKIANRKGDGALKVLVELV